jgi:GTPase SAR1 family protein
MPDENLRVKSTCWIIGAAAVGKTCIGSALRSEACQRYVPIITVDRSTMNWCPFSNIRVRVEICDTPSRGNLPVNEPYAPGSISQSANELAQATLIIIVLARNDTDSLNYYDSVSPTFISEMSRSTQFIVVVNKCDEPIAPAFSIEGVKRLAQRLRCEDRVFHLSVTNGSPAPEYQQEFENFRKTCSRLILK